MKITEELRSPSLITAAGRLWFLQSPVFGSGRRKATEMRQRATRFRIRSAPRVLFEWLITEMSLHEVNIKGRMILFAHWVVKVTHQCEKQALWMHRSQPGGIPARTGSLDSLERRSDLAPPLPKSPLFSRGTQIIHAVTFYSETPRRRSVRCLASRFATARLWFAAGAILDMSMFSQLQPGSPPAGPRSAEQKNRTYERCPSLQRKTQLTSLSRGRLTGVRVSMGTAGNLAVAGKNKGPFLRDGLKAAAVPEGAGPFQTEISEPEQRGVWETGHQDEL